ncbi:MAG: cycM [Rickettsiaceae bacterium]|jgi:cytochrome c|nr:cycM [Rickettsiaceae bacterium]
MIKSFILKNKLFFKNAALGFGFAIFVLGFSVLFSSLLYHPKRMVKRGFEIDLKAPEGAKVSKAPINIADLIKDANIDAGAKVFKKCASCHTVEKGGANKVGPNLYAIVGKKKASTAGFSYSPALQAKGGAWTIEDLNQWLTKPKDFVPGTKMGFAGLKKDKDRADVIAYLKANSK